MKCYDTSVQFENELIEFMKKGKEEENMASKLFISAKEVARELEVSDSFAYRLVRKLNDELEKQGFVVVKGKISRKYFEERVYGMSETK